MKKCLRKIPGICLLLLWAVTMSFSQTTPRAFEVSSKSYSYVVLSMNDLNANAAITIFVEKSTNGGAYTVAGSFASSPSTPNPYYYATGLSQSTAYCFRARARNPSGVYSGYSQVACSATDAVTAPTGLAVTGTGQTTAQVTWNYYGGKESGYRVYIERSTGNGGAFTQIADVDADVASPFNDTNLAPGTQYCYRIRGSKEGQLSPYTNGVCATTQQGPPTAPSALIAQSLAPTFQIQLNWIDGSGNETGFEIERSTDNVNFSKIATTAANVTQYNNTGLAASTLYHYRVRAVNSAGASGYTNIASATTNASPPAAPGNLSAIMANESQINLNWNDNSGNEESFEIERSQDGTNFSKIADVGANSTTYTSSGLNPNTQYWYRVRAKNNGGYSGYSNIANATTRDVSPATPNNLSATPVSNTQINLSWNDNSGNETGFEVERSTDGGNFTKIADLPANSNNYQSTGLNTLTKYWYRVRAKNTIGNSGYSNVAEATTFDVPPAAPSELSATTVSSSQINLAWKDNSGNESSFDIERSTDGTNFTKIADAGANATTFQSTGLTPNTKYWYRARSRNSQGGSTYTNVAEATTNDVAPAAPQNLAGTPLSNTQINLSWTDISGTYGNETGYELERSADGNTFTKIADLAANVTTYQNTGLSTLTRYWYRLRAKNALGYSPYSNVADVTTFDVPPIAPSNLTATMVSSSQIDLSWKDNSANETSFEIERSADGVNFSKIGEVGANVVTYQSVGLSPATKYWYRVRAKNTVNPSAYTNVADATTKDVIPNTPSNLSATVNDYFSINLAWSDNSGNEAKFLIERSTDGTNFTKIDSVGFNISKYLSKGLKDQTTYYFRVRALNAIGYSGYSNVASATTPKAPLPAKPENLKATPVDFDLIQLSWNELSPNSETVIIERSRKPDSDFTQIGSQLAAMTQFPDREILDVHDYYYRIKAVNAAGASPYSDVVKVAATSIITGTEPISGENLIYAYEKILHVVLSQAYSGSLILYNTRGMVVKTLPLATKMMVDLGTLPAGVYIVVIQDRKTVTSQKVLVY